MSYTARKIEEARTRIGDPEAARERARGPELDYEDALLWSHAYVFLLRVS